MAKKVSNYGGWRAVWGTSSESVAFFRIVLGVLLTLELVLRFRFLKPFYSDEGTLPLNLLIPKVDGIFKIVCLHCRLGHLWQQQLILSFQVFLSMLFTLGIATKWVAPTTWFLYLSLTLRNTWMSYILDRYFHYLLFLSMFLPLDERWAVGGIRSKTSKGLLISPATIAFKLLVLWIYFDAGYGKLMDPLGGWSYTADPLPALDTYARHTLIARYVYAILGPTGLRLMTPAVVYVELLAAPVAMIGAFIGSRRIIYLAISLISSLHFGIALTLRNSTLLSFAACSAWCIFVPIGWDFTTPQSNAFSCRTWRSSDKEIIAFIAILSMVAGTFWLETISQACDQSVKHIWSTLLHNRWNVFVGAEEYVTWEIAPGLLENGEIVDVWNKRDLVSWDLPSAGAPCTATGRPGRWRSFPYLAGLEGEDADALWSYLCKEWDDENGVDQDSRRRLVKFNFFMLQADVLPDMHFSPTRKRLIQSYDCPSGASLRVGAVDDVKSDHPEL